VQITSQIINTGYVLEEGILNELPHHRTEKRHVARFTNTNVTLLLGITSLPYRSAVSTVDRLPQGARDVTALQQMRIRWRQVRNESCLHGVQ